MAGKLTKPSQQVNPYLSPNQQDLLLAALSSQAKQPSVPAGRTLEKPIKLEPAAMTTAASGAPFMSPQADSFGLDYTPGLDYLDNDDSFDFEDADLGGEMIGALPGNGEGHEKRKNPDDGADTPEPDSKRQEMNDGEKAAKKPGRKPLTNEPTTKRKAQNRAAQRAFRERKEKHLKDLEEKVTSLTKTTEADKHENGMLKAQVERLQMELREYRKRLSLNSGSVRSSPPLNPMNSQQRSNSGSAYGENFSFDFPKFGALPGSQLFGNQSISNGNSPINQHDNVTPPVVQSPVNLNGFSQTQTQAQNSRQNSLGRSLSPQNAQRQNSNPGSTGSPAHLAGADVAFAPYSTNDNMHGFASTLPQMTGDGGSFGDLFSPNLLKSANMNNYFNNESQNSAPSSTRNTGSTDNGDDSTSGLNRVFQFNSVSNSSDTTSPSASSNSQWNMNGNGNSSCGTSPEPSHDSPALKDTFCDKVNKAATNAQLTPANLNSQSNMNSMYGFGNTDFTNPSPLNTFDPVLFGDYRDTNDAIVGGGDFTGGFFDDALNSVPFDYQSPSNLFGILQSPQQAQATLPAVNKPAAAPTPSRNLMAEIEKTCGGGDEDYGLPGTQKTTTTKPTDGGKFISCNNIWNQLQSNPDFKEGKFDLDGLCSELRAKAKCSESGVMVDQDHVNAALKKLGKKDEAGKPYDVPPLMFEQDSWDNVLKKLQNGGKA
ncbi:Putative basic-leucine zipper domain, transcription factor PAP1, Yap1 redox domain superfamily [Septoria linicola]|uniref:Basic-leucine zipper domain, transcription factor PAP1, Yap1 redox domain superfamily n=1 Tax=Septoria linicola TaxID=215465 RepID=A0A9Q9AKY4_9PEZI|nr:putative basic-leucine zipper domain, transcription factor PAP1, Yap1 redox domain superfamily [Septoria linicola]USW48340.1 Putative basic-leucine zipper domain, transcription factor PAP1, Yap1 redox domain superfamily [Septoria linicola]